MSASSRSIALSKKRQWLHHEAKDKSFRFYENIASSTAARRRRLRDLARGSNERLVIGWNVMASESPDEYAGGFTRDEMDDATDKQLRLDRQWPSST